MLVAPLPSNESERLKSLADHNLLDTLPEEVYDDITRLAAEICGTPIAAINLIADNHQWPKSAHEQEEGSVGIPVREYLTGSRDNSFCAHTILNPNEALIVPDARYDERFADNPFTLGDPQLIFYAGVPVKDAEGRALGSLCVIDSRPRELSEHKLESLKALAKLVNTHFQLRRTKLELEKKQRQVTAAQPILQTMIQTIGSMQSTNNSDEIKQVNSLLESAKSLQHVLDETPA
ncbi:GAF domain-containing protein [Hymenobacter sp. HDW8]|uniref:GAF domain-containing protein n=1 Tax=Hymenobacter sp. HDW8 TaxID=2714932 RepID=UPI00140DFF3F|nr:GAF domain-containing protein [Hymenobacter sp. HDW8]QIL77328.1 GAF domain-containing protein [Hymenobacter sp. HDW8]